MGLKKMRNAVLQASLFFTIQRLFTHHYSEHMFSEVRENPGYREMENSFEALSALRALRKNQTGPYTLNITKAGQERGLPGPGGDEGSQNNADELNNADESIVPTADYHGMDRYNGTVGNATEKQKGNETWDAKQKEESAKRFYTYILPCEVLLFAFLSALNYWWLLWLDHILPARTRTWEVPIAAKERAFDKIEDPEDREEEVVKKWIAQGRVQRSSLSWRNTILKWLIQISIGRVWYTLLEQEFMLRLGLLKAGDLRRMETTATFVFMSFMWSFLTAQPLLEIIAFIAVPVHMQIVFFAGGNLVVNVFMHTVINMLATWAVKTEYVQTICRNITQSMIETTNKERQKMFKKFEDEL